MFLPLQECELLGFYIWLKGRLTSRQRDDLSIVFVSCPAERPKLVKEFCRDVKAEHRLKAFNKYFNTLR